MAITGSPESTAEIRSIYDRSKEVKEFDDTKAGVKGLVDSGMDKIPKIFIHPSENLPKASDPNTTHLQIPIIDLEGVHGDQRIHIVNEIRRALETWGFFQMVNHSIPISVLDEMIEAIRRFNEQPMEAKMEFYSRDRTRKVRFLSNFDLYQSRAADWRDTFVCVFDAVDSLGSESLPLVCRDALLEYKKHTEMLGETLFGLVSEALGLSPTYLRDIECMKTQFMSCHYYPSCPQSDLTMGTKKHTDPAFLTILLQDHIGGLQVLHQQCWVDVAPMHGALIVNVGDLLQLLSNDRFKSIEHRVRANIVGPRISVACFFNNHLPPSNRTYGPIKELTSDENPPLYMETSAADYISYFSSQGLDGDRPLDHFRKYNGVI
ncbi:1-aminocyclopropane-1-carboxylate oxidase homolog 1-like [Magnolia sinica]|uniref:1-aminocyclopropane-1-carboxylate oxidase homolog 1-like n=1 Tax=Magnolia sinica TaxID=86752 RepID=UPI00265AA922|nr:1-aminocyclopropane-1-carboxylate oxidase homolog 1-like [Magnolia sinica]